MAAAECPMHPVRWLTVEDIRKQQRMRRDAVVAAMLAGELPFEQRGRIRYARITDVQAWEDSRIRREKMPERLLVRSRGVCRLSQLGLAGATCSWQAAPTGLFESHAMAGPSLHFRAMLHYKGRFVVRHPSPVIATKPVNFSRFLRFEKSTLSGLVRLGS